MDQYPDLRILALPEDGIEGVVYQRTINEKRIEVTSEEKILAAIRTPLMED
jgi:hypothetical protein